MDAMFKLTKRFTAEFAIRDFIIQQPERTLSYLEKWLDDECPHVRRLCSEGTRPKLPWGKRLQCFVQDPEPTIPFLNALKTMNPITLEEVLPITLEISQKTILNLCFRCVKIGLSKAYRLRSNGSLDTLYVTQQKRKTSAHST